GNPIDPGGPQGLLALTQPWPSMLRTLYHDDERYVETYWKRFGPETYFVGDASRCDDDGYFWVIGRLDRPGQRGVRGSRGRRDWGGLAGGPVRAGGYPLPARRPGLSAPAA
ncbi:MAG: hypothetical protein ACKOTA_00120, partial [Solirubrobacterales bacterium]